MLNLNWIKSIEGQWLPLLRVNLTNVTDRGVYIIWHAGQPGRVVRLGQGIIADRLNDHRGDPHILAFGQYGQLYVTWASVPAAQRDGVERYLANAWNPLVGDAFPDVQPIAVNSPWG